jgi:hypothetical protein
MEVHHMLCTHCNHDNDVDAVFCDECGKPLGAGPFVSPARSRKAYLFIIVLVPVLLLVGWFGYYKFILPDGIAAVVNGEDIKLSELDAEIVRTQTAPESVTGRLRYQMLNGMIAERLFLQAAIKAKMSVSRDEVAAAVALARSASGPDEKAFEKEIRSQYGSASAFERALERDLLIKKFINGKVLTAGADPMAARAAVGKWLQEASSKSTIRIALAENGSTSGCGSKAGCGDGCTMTGGQQQKQPASTGPCCKTSVPAAPSGQQKDRSKAAEAACLKYWHDKHGADTVTAKLTDYGCHMQVDIIKNNKNIATLRYQNGSITEL